MLQIEKEYAIVTEKGERLRIGDRVRFEEYDYLTHRLLIYFGTIHQIDPCDTDGRKIIKFVSLCCEDTPDVKGCSGLDLKDLHNLVKAD